MNSPFSKLIRLLILFGLTASLFACSPAAPTADPNLIWRVDLLKSEVKDKLEGVEVVQQYIGSTEVAHSQYPDDGYVYLIMDVKIVKQNASTTPFVWDQLTVQDSAGNAYHRMDNDTFLETYKYTPRITGLQLVLSGNDGWMCYQIPTSAADGSLTLVYSGEGSQQQIPIKK
jgi:hypothetical protein